MNNYQEMLSNELKYYNEEIRNKILDSFFQSIDDLKLENDYTILEQSLGSPQEFVKEYLEVHGFEEQKGIQRPKEFVNEFLQDRGYYQKLGPKLTPWLTISIMLVWVGVVFSVFVGIVLLFNREPIGLLFLLIGIINSWVGFELPRFNNTARIIGVILTIISVLLGLLDWTKNIISILLGINVIYGLVFNKKTVVLFTEEHIPEAIIE